MVRNYASLFLKPLIQLLNPRIIITLGKMPYLGVSHVFRLGNSTSASLRSIVESPPIRIADGLTLVPMSHCGSLGLANRSLEKQKRDWSILKIRLQEMQNRPKESKPFTVDRNREAQKLLEEIARLAVRLQEIYALEAILNELRLTEEGKRYFEEWRAIRAEGNELREKLKSTTGQL